MKTKKTNLKLSLNKQSIAHLELQGKDLKIARGGLSGEECLHTARNCLSDVMGISCIHYTCNMEHC